MNFVECFFNDCFDSKVSPGLAFSKITKSFKNHYVLGFKNFGSLIVLIQNWQQKDRRFRIFLVFGAAKPMNSRILVQGR